MAETEQIECECCGDILNPIQEPRVFNDDLDPRDVDGSEYCYDCWSENFEYCGVCDEEVGRDSLCLHLFRDLSGEMAGMGVYSESEVAKVAEYYKKSFQKFILTIANEEITNNRWIAEGLARSQVIIEHLLRTASFLEKNNFRAFTSGNMFSTDSLTFGSVERDETEKYLYWIIHTRRLYQKRDLIHDGGQWMRCLGREKTPFWNKLFAGWIREVLPKIERVHQRYFRQKSSGINHKCLV